MLILTRRKDEVIRISGGIRIQVLELAGKHVRLGIEAPPEVIVDREEVHLRKQEELRLIQSPTLASGDPSRKLRRL